MLVRRARAYIAVPACRKSWSISSHFSAIHSWNVCHRPKSRRIK